MKSHVYELQNVAIHKARAQLEEIGVLDPWAGLDQIRDMAPNLTSASDLFPGFHLNSTAR